MERSLKTNGSLGRHCTHSQAGEVTQKKFEPSTALRINTSDRTGSDLFSDANKLNKNGHTCVHRWRMWGSPEQWFEVTRWINYSGAAAATRKPLCIHQTCNHSFLYCFKLLNNIISNSSHDDQQARWNFTGISKRVDFFRQSNEETAIMLEPDIPVGLSSLVPLATSPFPCLTAGSMGTSHLSGQDKSCQSAQNYPFSTQHDNIMPVILYGCISSDRWQQNYEGIESNGLIPAGSSVPLSTDRYHGSSVGCIPLW